MRKWILLIIPLLIWYHTAIQAQDEVGCAQLLEDAREAYAGGMVELVPDLLLPCIGSGLEGIPKWEAYKLVINSYLFDYLPDKADELMTVFMNENPGYRADPSDPVEFKLLLETHQQRRANEAAARAEQENARQRAELEARQRAELEAKQQRELQKQQQKNRSRTHTSNLYSPRLGIALGFNSSFGQVIEPYSLGNPLLDSGAFSLSPGFLLGGVSDFPLGRSLELSIELLYNRTRINYKAVPSPFTHYNYLEIHNRLQLPVSLAVYLNPDNKTRVYLRFGVVTDYLFSASARGTRSYAVTGSSILNDVELEKTKITDSRSKMNVYGLAGLGVRIPLDNSFFFVETRYAAGLFLANREEKRYDNQDALWVPYHVDSDFRMNQLSLNVGITWNLN